MGVVPPVGVVLSRMEALSLPEFATAKSGFSSKLKSLMLTQTGPWRAMKGTWGAKPSTPL